MYYYWGCIDIGVEEAVAYHGNWTVGDCRNEV